jgi:hypothetical protein
MKKYFIWPKFILVWCSTTKQQKSCAKHLTALIGIFSREENTGQSF